MDKRAPSAGVPSPPISGDNSDHDPPDRQVYDNYCDSCEEVGCGDCILSSHRAHKSCTLESKEAEVKSLLQSRLDGLR